MAWKWRRSRRHRARGIPWLRSIRNSSQMIVSRIAAAAAERMHQTIVCIGASHKKPCFSRSGQACMGRCCAMGCVLAAPHDHAPKKRPAAWPVQPGRPPVLTLHNVALITRASFGAFFVWPSRCWAACLAPPPPPMPALQRNNTHDDKGGFVWYYCWLVVTTGRGGCSW